MQGNTVTGVGADRDWGADKSTTTQAGLEFRFQVANFTAADIAGQFNAARALDPTIKEKLIMPSQADWDLMDANDKALFLVNSERCARGIMPLSGSYSMLVDSADTYSKVMSASGNLSHTEPAGSGTDKEAAIAGRMTAVGVDTASGGNADFIEQNESLAFVQASAVWPSSSPGARNTLKEVEARAVYNWLYDDIQDSSTTGYGHRTHLLRNKYEDNSGNAGEEGLFGLATEINTDRSDTVEPNIQLHTQAWVTVHTFDPNGTFNMGAITSPPVIYGPKSQADCGSGTYTESVDANGSNTSTCE